LLVWHPQWLLSVFFMWPGYGLTAGIKPFATDGSFAKFTAIRRPRLRVSSFG
jgi:hypothetical protein